MSKRIKRILSLLLCLALLCGTLALSVQATDTKAAKTTTKKCTCSELPRVGIPGIGDTLYYDFGTPEQRAAPLPDMDGLKAQIVPMVKALIAAVAARSWEKAGDMLTALANGMFAHLQVDTNGKSVQPISNPAVYKEHDHKSGGEYKFNYDWRMDPMENAVLLNKFIKQVKAGTGHDKVVLTSDSEGGLVAAAYLAQFGTGDIEHFIPHVAAFNGLTLLGELFTGNVEIGYRQTTEFLRQFGNFYDEDSGFMSLFAPIADLLDSTGLAAPLVFALKQLVEKSKDKLFEETLVPMFGQWPALWGFVPEEYYEDAKTFMFGDNPKYKNFIKLIDNFHYKAGPGMANKVLAKANKSTKISVIACYGFTPMPFTPKNGYDTDGLIDTARESCGATTAGLNKTFSAGYKQKVNDGHNHVSPDMRIDASTCLLPDQTWFYKNKLHFFGECGDLISFLIHSKKQPTVFDDPRFPQFMTRLPDGTKIPTVPEEPAAPFTVGSSIKNMWNASVSAIRKSIKG